MLPEFGWAELLMIGIVLIVVVGPKDLPRVVKGIGKGVQSVKKLSADFQRQFSDAMDEADMAGIRDTMRDVRDLDPRRQIKDALKPLDDEAQKLKSELDGAVSKINTDVESNAVKPPASAVDDALSAAGAKARAAQKTPTAKAEDRLAQPDISSAEASDGPVKKALSKSTGAGGETIAKVPETKKTAPKKRASTPKSAQKTTRKKTANKAAAAKENAGDKPA